MSFFYVCKTKFKITFFVIYMTIVCICVIVFKHQILALVVGKFLWHGCWSIGVTWRCSGFNLRYLTRLNPFVDDPLSKLFLPDILIFTHILHACYSFVPLSHLLNSFRELTFKYPILAFGGTNNVYTTAGKLAQHVDDKGSIPSSYLS